MNMLKVGDKVMWRGSFNQDEPKVATVETIEVTKQPNEKEGDSVDEVSWDMVKQNRVVVVLDNNKWAYSNQIRPIE